MNDEEQLGTFLNLMTDFGFKRVFGSEQHKSVLIRLLNTLFKKEGIKVDDVVFHDKEVLPPTEDGKRIVYDVYCTTLEEKEHFIVEMQQVYHANLDKRVVYYLTKGFAGQGWKGDNYNYSPVFGLFFVDFQFKHLLKKLVHDFRLSEVETHQIFSNHLRLLIVCLEEVKRSWEECETELERTTYLIKNMHHMDKNSEAYKSREYEDMFKASEIADMANEEVVEYRKSKRAYDDLKLYRMGGYDDGMEEGIGIGVQRGIEIGREEGIGIGQRKMMEDIALNMISQGFPDATIIDVTGITVTRLYELRSSFR